MTDNGKTKAAKNGSQDDKKGEETTMTAADATIMTDVPKVPLWKRILRFVPILGWILNDQNMSVTQTWIGLGALVSAWGCAIFLFGFPGLIIPALFMVFMMFVVIVLISRG